jgi:hypothetical protein
MGISLRHHVLSLVAVFLMLLVGLLVGVGLSSDPDLTHAMDLLREDFKEVMSENSALNQGLQRQERFGRAALPRLVRGALEGQCVAVFVTSRPEDNPMATQIVEVLQLAGAHVPYRVVIRKGFADRAADVFGSGRATAEACEKAAQTLAGHVVKADGNGLHSLRRRGLIRIRGRVDGVKPSGAVIVGGAKQGTEVLAETVDGPLIEALLAGGLKTIVGCEDSPEVSYIESYRELDISTVDNVDLVRGQFSLVMALAGQPGNYGDGPSAEQEFATLE